MTSIVLTDGATNPLTLSVQQYANDAGLLNDIFKALIVAISGDAADVFPLSDGDTHVSSILVADGAPLTLSAAEALSDNGGFGRDRRLPSDCRAANVAANSLHALQQRQAG